MRKIFAVLPVFLLIFSCCLAQETLTISTYYPSPYGSYHELDVDILKLNPQAAAPSGDYGELYFDAAQNRVEYNDGNQWVTLRGMNFFNPPPVGTLFTTCAQANYPTWWLANFASRLPSATTRAIVRFECGQANVFVRAFNGAYVYQVCSAGNNDTQINEMFVELSGSRTFEYQISGTDCPNLSFRYSLIGYVH